MDPNKLKKLKEIGYKVNRTCSMCISSNFMHMSNWGACKRFVYDHLKHSDKRHLSIHRSGSCPAFEMNKARLAKLQGYTEFIDGQETG